MALPGLSFEIVRSSGPVLGIRSDQTAMIALTERGPALTPTLVHSIDEFTEQFGGPTPGMLGAIEAQGYYDNGGEQLIVTRFVPAEAQFAQATLPVVGATQAAPFALNLWASGPGAFGNAIQVETALSLRRRAKGSLSPSTPAGTFQLTGLAPPVLSTDAGAPARLIVTPPSPGPVVVQWGKIVTVAAGGAAITFVPGVLPVPPVPPFPPPAPPPPAPPSWPAIVEVYDPTFTLTIREPARADIVVTGLDLRDLADMYVDLAGTSITIPPPLPALPLPPSALPNATDVELPVPGVTTFSGGVDGMSLSPAPGAVQAMTGVLPLPPLAVVGATDPTNPVGPPPPYTFALEATEAGTAGNLLTVLFLLTVKRVVFGQLTAVGAGKVFQIDGLEQQDVGSPAEVFLGSSTTPFWGKVQAAATTAAPSGPCREPPSCAPPVFVPGPPPASPPPAPSPPEQAMVQVYEPTFTVQISQGSVLLHTVSGLDLRDLDAARTLLAGSGVTIPPGVLGTVDVELPAPVSAGFGGGLDGTPTANRVQNLALSFQACIAALEVVDQPDTLADIVIAPDLWSAIWGTKGGSFLAFDPTTAMGLADQMVLSAWRTSDRVVILDPPLDDNLAPLTPPDVVAWRAARAASLGPAAAVGPLVGLISAGTDFAAAFTPWPEVVAGGTYQGDDTMLLPPSGYVAGRMARTSRERGPWIATGNVSLEDVVGLDERLSIQDQEALQAAGICPLRVELPVGATIQGVRSLSWPERPPWGYLSTRRLFNYLRRVITPIGLSYVFESNTPATWLALRRDITRFLRDMFLRGAFAGAQPSDAYFVQIDATLNPEDAIEAGVMTALIGVAPAIPLEFLLVRLIVQRNTASVTEAAP